MRRLLAVVVAASLLAVPVAAATVPISLSVSDPGETTAGGTVEVTLSVTNDGDGPSDAMGVQVEGVPEPLTVAEIRSPNGSVAANRNAVFWTDPVPAGETVTATYVVTVDGDAPADAYEFTARAASGDSEVQQGVTVEVVPPNQPPEASVDAPSEATVGEPVTFDGSGSSDPDGTVASYEWDLDGDGEYEATGATVEHSFDEPGERAVELRVTDDDGAGATVLRDVQVTEATATTTRDDGGNDSGGSDGTGNASAAAVADDGSPFDLENAPVLLGAVAVALVVLFVGWYLVRGGDDGDDAAPADGSGPDGAGGPSEFGEPQPSSGDGRPSDQPPPRERAGREQGAANGGRTGAGLAESGEPAAGGTGRTARSEPARPARDAPDRPAGGEPNRPTEPVGGAEREPPRQPGGEASGTEPRRNPEHDRPRDDPDRPNSDPEPPADDAGGDPAAGDGTDGDPAGGTEPEGTIESPAYCPHCGAAVAEYDLPTLEFCPDCGSDLHE